MFLGLDIGTSAVKAVVVDGVGAVIEQKSRPLGLYRPRPDWAEQQPQDWWQAVDDAVCALNVRARAAVRGIGLSGQMHGAVLLGTDDQPLRPAILWNDGRSQAQCESLLRLEPRVTQITGNPVLPGFTAPKLLWVRAHEPGVFAKVRTVLLPKDWVRLRLTGEKLSEMSDASGTLWLDVDRRRWSAEMLAACDINVEMMPALREGNEPAGTLLASIAARWGMNRVVVAGGGGDNAAAAIGLGVVRPGQTLLSLGTSGVIFTVGDGFRPCPEVGIHAFAHAIPRTWHRMSVMLSAAACIDWAAALTGLSVPEFLAEAGTADPTSALLFLPYLSGERTPHANPAARGVFFGLSSSTARQEVARAVMEGVAMGLRDGLDVLAGAGTAISDISMTGGGSRSQAWGAILSAALGRPLTWHEGGDIGPALGAARLAQIAAGEGLVNEVCVTPRIIARFEPDCALVDAMQVRQKRFRSLYQAVFSLWSP